MVHDDLGGMAAGMSAEGEFTTVGGVQSDAGSTDSSVRLKLAAPGAAGWRGRPSVGGRRPSSKAHLLPGCRSSLPPYRQLHELAHLSTKRLLLERTAEVAIAEPYSRNGPHAFSLASTCSEGA